MNENTEKQIEYIKSTLKAAYFAAKQAHDIVFEEGNQKEKNFMSSIYVNKAITLMTSCQTIYNSNFSELANNDLENIFHKFDVFSREILSNIRTNHSHQWTDIEFTSYVESLECFISID